MKKNLFKSILLSFTLVSAGILNSSAQSCSGFKTQNANQWGIPAHGNNPGMYLKNQFPTAFPNGLTIGCDYTLKFTTAKAISDFLPCSGSAYVLSSSQQNPSCIGSDYAQQVLALALNIGIDRSDANFASSNLLLADQVVVSGPFAGWTVQRVFEEASRYLGGCGSSFTGAQLKSAVTSINGNYSGNGNGNGGYLNCPVFNPPAPVCPAPVNIAVGDFSSSTALVTWNDASGAYKYRLRRRPVAGGDWVYSSEYAPITQRKFINLLANTEYQFEIQTYCNSSLTDSSGWVAGPNFITLPYCTYPTETSTENISSTSAQGVWNTLENSSGYRLRIREEGSETWTVYLVGDKSAFVFKGLNPSTSYEWSVRSKCNDFDYDISSWSPTLKFSTAPLVRMSGSEELANDQISLFPNPTSGSMTIAMNTGCSCDNSATIEIHNVLGQSVYNSTVNAANGNIKESVNLSENAVTGTYFIRITQDNKTFIARFNVAK